MNAKVDADGYLIDFNDWTPEIAEQLAKNDSITLKQEHWIIIQCLKDFYQEYNVKVIPTRTFLKKLTTVLEPTKCTSTYLYTFFPKGLAQVSKIAGLPKSTRCTKGIF